MIRVLLSELRPINTVRCLLPIFIKGSKQLKIGCQTIQVSNFKLFAALSTANPLKMPIARGDDRGMNRHPAEDNPQWKQHMPYLFSVTLPKISVRRTAQESEIAKDTKVLLITRSDGVHKIGYLPNEGKDTRLADDARARQAYLCKLGKILAGKAGLSSGGNRIDDDVWDALPEILFGYEIFERARGIVSGNRASDVYVVGHPIEGGGEGLFRTAEEFAQHLWWLAEGDEEKDCLCVLCTKEAKRRLRKVTGKKEGDVVTAWKRECNDRAKSYLDSTRLGSFWGNLPEWNMHAGDASDHHNY